eukprot:SAG31_NODE_4780_length_2959_cov_3.151049_2_plen_185_part_00
MVFRTADWRSMAVMCAVAITLLAPTVVTRSFKGPSNVTMASVTTTISTTDAKPIARLGLGVATGSSKSRRRVTMARRMETTKIVTWIVLVFRLLIERQRQQGHFSWSREGMASPALQISTPTTTHLFQVPEMFQILPDMWAPHGLLMASLPIKIIASGKQDFMTFRTQSILQTISLGRNPARRR